MTPYFSRGEKLHLLNIMTIVAPLGSVKWEIVANRRNSAHASHPSAMVISVMVQNIAAFFINSSRTHE